MRLPLLRPLDARVAEITFDSTGLVKAFPNLNDNELPEDTIAMHMTPNGQHWWLAGQFGEIKEVHTRATDSRSYLPLLLLHHLWFNGERGFVCVPHYAKIRPLVGIFFC